MSKKNIFSNSSKGDFGYLSSEKKKRILITSILFAVPLLIFFTAYKTDYLDCRSSCRLSACM